MKRRTQPGSEPTAKRAKTDTQAPSSGKSHPAPTTRKSKAAPPSRVKTAKTINSVPSQVLEVFVFGGGDLGELGLGPGEQETPIPLLNPFLDPKDSSALRIVQIDCGAVHAAALTADGKVATWGVNDAGALGRDCTWEGGLRDIDDDDSDENGELNPLESTPTLIPDADFPVNTKFVQVSAGDNCTLALTDTGYVYGWGTFRSPEAVETFGYNARGNLVERQERPARIPGLENITRIACGANHAMALDTNGDLWTWGCAERNQLGRRSSGSRHVPDSFKPDRVGIRNVRYIASGPNHSFAVDERGNTWAWGRNNFGQAGYAKAAGSDDVLLPYPMKIRPLFRKGVICLDAGQNHSAAVTADGQCLVWGNLVDGQLGIDFTAEQLQDETLIRRDERDKPRICLRPTPVPGLGRVTHVSCGTDHTLVVTEEGRAFATGFNPHGQLGIKSFDDVDVFHRVRGEAVKDKKLVWAGAGAQFSVVASLFDSVRET